MEKMKSSRHLIDNSFENLIIKFLQFCALIFFSLTRVVVVAVLLIAVRPDPGGITKLK
jgi:hypothetical protein